MENITKKTKTILFASLIAAMILPFSTMDFAEAKVQADKIPEDKLIDRPNNWKDRIALSTDEFEQEDRKFREYVNNADHPDNKWNKITKKNQIIIYNFDSIVGQEHAGLNALLVDVEKQKSSGTYNPTEPEKRFHEWAAQIITNPELPDAKQKLIYKVIEKYNQSANLGHVPNDLFKSDVDFWSNVVADKLCDYNKECNTDGPQFDDPMCAFVNCAYGDEISIGHLLSVTVDVSSCWGTSSCTFSDSKWLIGDGSLSISSGDGHSSVKRVEYYINDKSWYTPVNESHTIDGTVHLGFSSYNIPSSTANNSVTIDRSHLFSLTCGGANPVNCGTYSLTAHADDVTIVV